MDYEQQVYEVPELWVEGALPSENKARASTVLSKLPSGVRTVLDAGCGGGIFVNYIVDHAAGRFARLVGADRSRAALSQVRGETVEASIDHLPFRDREFDAAVCMEVIEHLPHGVYNNALAELARVASNYIVITVPDSQDLERSQCKCPMCSTMFEPNYHVRSFDKASMKGLLANYGFRCTEVFQMNGTPFYFGVSHYNAWRARRAQKREFPETTICPLCGFRTTEKLRGKVPYGIEHERRARQSVVKTALKRVWPHETIYSWVGGVYVRSQ